MREWVSRRQEQANKWEGKKNNEIQIIFNLKPCKYRTTQKKRTWKHFAIRINRQARRINTQKKERRKVYSYIAIWGDFDIIFHEPRSFRSSSHSHNVSLLLVICIFVFSIFYFFFLDALIKLWATFLFFRVFLLSVLSASVHIWCNIIHVWMSMSR